MTELVAPVANTRLCPKCDQCHPEGDFRSANVRCKCKTCIVSGNAARCKAWAEANRERLNETVRRYRRRRYEREGCWRDDSPKGAALKTWMLELKSKPCADCGGRFQTCCMDFDHREGTVKKHNIGSMFAHHYGREEIELELAKCDLVCANCHRRAHPGPAHWSTDWTLQATGCSGNSRARRIAKGARVRGLTNEERACLLNEDRSICFEATGDRLRKRGLIADTGLCSTCNKGERACGCDPVCFYSWCATTTHGHLALRLDAAARAVTGVTA